MAGEAVQLWLHGAHHERWTCHGNAQEAKTGIMQSLSHVIGLLIAGT